jgi:short-subunit dehydrogenase
VRPKAVRGINVERVARAVLRGIQKQKREVVVPWTMHPAIKVYQLFPGVIDIVMARMAKKGF